MAKTKRGTTELETTVVRLQRAMDELDEAASYFERLGMTTQSDQLDSAAEQIEDVHELLECLLGRIELSPDTLAPEAVPKLKAKRGKTHLVKSVAA